VAQGSSDDGEDDGTPAAAPGSDDDDVEGTAPGAHYCRSGLAVRLQMGGADAIGR